MSLARRLRAGTWYQRFIFFSVQGKYLPVKPACRSNGTSDTSVELHAQHKPKCFLEKGKQFKLNSTILACQALVARRFHYLTWKAEVHKSVRKEIK